MAAIAAGSRRRPTPVLCISSLRNVSTSTSFCGAVARPSHHRQRLGPYRRGRGVGRGQHRLLRHGDRSGVPVAHTKALATYVGVHNSSSGGPEFVSTSPKGVNLRP